MATMSAAAARAILARLGFRVNTAARFEQAVRDFQGGWNLGPRLDVDGIVGPKTTAALALSEQRRRAGRGTASAHFSFSEFLCKCGGRYASCRRYVGEGPAGSRRHTGRWLLQSLEQLRAAAYPHGLVVVSGTRCPGHNAAVGGASSSQHMFGSAADTQPVASTARVAALHAFAGIGYQGSTGLVRHVDRRDASGVNPTRGSRAHPTLWRY